MSIFEDFNDYRSYKHSLRWSNTVLARAFADAN